MSDRIRAWKKVAILTISVLLSLLFVGMAGITKLAGAKFQLETFDHFGYPVWFMYVVGVVEVVAGLLILFPKIRFYGAVSMVCVILGVLYSFAKQGEIGNLPGPTAVMGLAGLVAWSSRPWQKA